MLPFLLLPAAALFVACGILSAKAVRGSRSRLALFSASVSFVTAGLCVLVTGLWSTAQGDPTLQLLMGSLVLACSALGLLLSAHLRNTAQSIELLKRQAYALSDELKSFLTSSQVETSAQMSERQRQETPSPNAQRMQSLGTLARGIAHDFNNLLVGVIGNTDLALRDLEPDSKLHELLEHVRVAAQSAAELANQMLAYAGDQAVPRQPVEISGAIARMAPLLESSTYHGVTTEFDLAPDLPPILCDESQLHQIVMNLVFNSSEAIGEHPGTIQIQTGLMDVDRDYLAQTFGKEELPEGEYLFISVKDTGGGVEAELLERVFEPFFTTKFTGRGLGLAVVYGIVQNHGGGIRVTSEPGRGTRMTVLLPPSSSQIEPESHTEPSSTGIWEGEGTVLLVDDDDMVRDVARRMLEEQGYSVIVAEDGPKALAIFGERAESIRIVVLDLTMPGMNGEEVFCEIRRMSSAVPVVFSSGYAEQEALKRFTEQGAAGFIQKPFVSAQLAEALRCACQGQAS